MEEYGERLQPGRSLSLLHSRWAATAASIWVQCTSGSLYTFSVYSPLLKSSLEYTQSTLDTVSVFKDVGGNVGVLAGLLYSLTASRGGSSRRLLSLGPWVVLLAGAVQNFLGYFLIWASVEGIIPRPPVAAMCSFMLIAAHAQSFFNTADVVTAVRNFPGYSGTAVGIMKGFIGLSAAILVQLYQAVFHGDASSFLLMLALLPTVNTMLLMWIVKVHNARDGDDKRFLNAFSAVAMIVAGYLTVLIVLQNMFGYLVVLRVLALGVLLILLLSPLCVAARAHQEDCQKVELPSNDYRRLPGDKEEQHEERCPSNSKWMDFRQRGEDCNLVQAMLTMEFWILIFSMACGMGSGLATSNNLGQIGESLGYANEEVNTVLSLWSIWNFLGRFGAGYISDMLLLSQGWARPLFMTITLAVLSVGHLVFASGLPGALYAGSVLVGVSYGSQWSLMPTVTAEIYGTKHMGTIFNAITMANPVGSYIFSVRVIGYIYDKEAAKTGEGNRCTGRHCFMLSFLIMASTTLLGSLAALFLYLRTKDFYKRVILRAIRRGTTSQGQH
ncbi:hypothetical protein MLD38_032758 [Melastoma candidum]|uniref:Uncharacterized protein n=1 Tax=Melastoma candidum TaxID=119954 RepID=A0ACB9M4R7_9MYRT|nr:hypothetical protein MLD38_032758 [Melastoma candidum]